MRYLSKKEVKVIKSDNAGLFQDDADACNDYFTMEARWEK